MGQGQSQQGAYAKLESHREALYKRQLEHHQRCEETRRRAREQLRLGNRVGAVNLARQLKTLETQERTIAGIVTNLDAQKATLETKQITNDTMNVMAACVKTLGKGSLSVAAVENTMELNDDAAAELREVADALSIPLDASDSDDFLCRSSRMPLPRRMWPHPAPWPAPAATMLFSRGSDSPPGRPTHRTTSLPSAPTQPLPGEPSLDSPH